MPFAEQHTLKPAGVQAPRLRRLLAYLVITHRLVARPPAPAPAGEEEAYVLIEQLGCYEREEPPLAQEDASFSQVGTAPGLAVYLNQGMLCLSGSPSMSSCTMTCWKLPNRHAMPWIHNRHVMQCCKPPLG